MPLKYTTTDSQFTVINSGEYLAVLSNIAETLSKFPGKTGEPYMQFEYEFELRNANASKTQVITPTDHILTMKAWTSTHTSKNAKATTLYMAAMKLDEPPREVDWSLAHGKFIVLCIIRRVKEDGTEFNRVVGWLPATKENAARCSVISFPDPDDINEFELDDEPPMKTTQTDEGDPF